MQRPTGHQPRARVSVGAGRHDCTVVRAHLIRPTRQPERGSTPLSGLDSRRSSLRHPSETMRATCVVGVVWTILGLLTVVADAEAVDDDSGIVRQFSDLKGQPYTVGYDGRSMLVGGKPVLLMSGSAHYVRSTPEMWPEIFAKMKASGLNAVESCELSPFPRCSYMQAFVTRKAPLLLLLDVFWNYHVRTLEDHTANNPDYTGRGNVTLFLELAAKADLFVVRDWPHPCF